MCGRMWSEEVFYEFISIDYDCFKRLSLIEIVLIYFFKEAFLSFLVLYSFL
jgi:hypothetical protein